MTKNVKWIFVVLVFSSLISFSFVGKDTPTEGVTVGDKAPAFTLSNNEQMLTSQQLKGSYVLLSFWASYDAASRTQNAILSHAAQQCGNVKMVSVSFDEYKSVFDETIRKDQIDSENCFWEQEGRDSKLYRSFRLEKGLKNFLLDDKGVIVAKNVTVSDLSAFLN